MLTLGLLDDRGYHFKMSEMALLPERMMRVPAFLKIIENHVLVSVSLRFNLADFERAKKRIQVPPFGWFNFAAWDSPHYYAYRSLLDMFHGNKGMFAEHGVPISAPVDFIFDEHVSKKLLLEAWDHYIASRTPDVGALFGSAPIFADDRQFLPLQAADLWAWWVRKWVRSGVEEQAFDFGNFKKQSNISHIAMHANEHQIADTYRMIAAQAVPTSMWVIDVDLLALRLSATRGQCRDSSRIVRRSELKGKRLHQLKEDGLRIV